MMGSLGAGVLWPKDTTMLDSGRRDAEIKGVLRKGFFMNDITCEVDTEASVWKSLCSTAEFGHTKS